MVTRNGWRRGGGALAVFVVVLTVALGAYGASNGYLIDSSSAAPILPAALTLGLVVGFLALVSLIGSRNGGWVHTPYW